MLPKRLRNMPVKYLSQMRPSICTRFQNTQNLRSQTSAQATEIIKKCKFFENSHHHDKCPAYGKVCHNGNGKNHFKKCCPHNRKTLHKIEQTETESPSADDCKFFLDMVNLQENPENLVNISQIKNKPSNLNINLSSNGTPISYKIDTGAQC